MKHQLKISASVQELKQPKKLSFLNNQKGHFAGIFLGIAIWGIYLSIVIQWAMRYFELMNSRVHADLPSLTKVLLIFPGTLILCILAGSIHLYIKDRHEIEKPWKDIPILMLLNTTIYLGCLLLLGIFCSFGLLIIDLVRAL